MLAELPWTQRVPRCRGNTDPAPVVAEHLFDRKVGQEAAHEGLDRFGIVEIDPAVDWRTEGDQHVAVLARLVENTISEQLGLGREEDQRLQPALHLQIELVPLARMVLFAIAVLPGAAAARTDLAGRVHRHRDDREAAEMRSSASVTSGSPHPRRPTQLHHRGRQAHAEAAVRPCARSASRSRPELVARAVVEQPRRIAIDQRPPAQHLGGRRLRSAVTGWWPSSRS